MKNKIQQFIIVGLLTFALTSSIKAGGSFSEGIFACDPEDPTNCADVVCTDSGDCSLNIHDADFHEILISEFFHQHTEDTQNLTVTAPTGTTTIAVADATTFDVGEYIEIIEGATEEGVFPLITAKTANTLTLDKPIDNSYTTSATAEVIYTDMADIAGSLATAQRYIIDVPSDEVWHIKRFMISCTDGSAPDYSNFCGISALANGVMLGVSNGATTTLSIWKKQADLVNDMYDVSSQAKTGGGEWGLGGRWTPGRVEVALKLDGSANEKLIILIQDDLTAITEFKVKAQGHVEGQ